MRFVMMVLVALALSCSVIAAGMGVPEALRGSQTIDGDESDILDAKVLLQGGTGESELTFFAEVNASGLTVNGESLKYERSLTLQPYENKEVSLRLRGVRDGSYLVTWGFIEHNDGSGFPVETRVDKTTVVRVRDVAEQNVTVPVTTTVSTGGRRGGGGGGAVAPATVTSPVVEEKGGSVLSSDSSGGAVAVDVGAGVGGIAQGVVRDVESVVESSSLDTGFGEVAVVDTAGKAVIVMIVVLSVVAGLSALYAMKKMKSEGV